MVCCAAPGLAQLDDCDGDGTTDRDQIARKPWVDGNGGGVLDSSTLGTLVAQVDLTAIPQPTGPVAVQPGETWHFQAWHRTTLAGQPTSDFTDAVRVTLQ